MYLEKWCTLPRYLHYLHYLPTYTTYLYLHYLPNRSNPNGKYCTYLNKPVADGNKLPTTRLGTDPQHPAQSVRA